MQVLVNIAIRTLVQAEGELGSFRRFQAMPQHRRAPALHQLRRFLGTRATRKIRCARRLVEAMDRARLPHPLAQLAARLLGGMPHSQAGSIRLSPSVADTVRPMLRIRSFKPEDAGAIAAQELLRWAATQRVARIYLGTTAKFLAAHRFYEKNGFTEIDAAALPGSFPIMTVDTKFYCLALQPGAPSSPVDRSMP